MRSRRRAFFELDNAVPALIVIIALIVSFEPRVFGVEISDRQITLALFGLLGVNAIVERSGHLYRMSGKIAQIAEHLDPGVSAGKVLRTRATFERTETLIAGAKRDVLIVGVNLQAATDALPSLVDLAKAGRRIKLLTVDPDGDALEHGARMSGVDPELRRQKVRQNLNLITGHLNARLTPTARRKCTIQVADRIIPTGVIGVDTEARDGWLIVQHYLTDTPAERAPLIWLRRDTDPEWFDRYLDQCRACFVDAREW